MTIIRAIIGQMNRTFPLVVASAISVAIHGAGVPADAAPIIAPAATAAVDVASDTAAVYRRALGLEGAPNFRDIGEYATRDGCHVRWGLVYRSNTLGNLTPADAARVDQLNLAAVVDLRTEEERAQLPSIWVHRPVDVYESPKQTLGPVRVQAPQIYVKGRHPPQTGPCFHSIQ